jgi:hypothetical protein
MVSKLHTAVNRVLRRIWTEESLGDRRMEETA